MRDRLAGFWAKKRASAIDVLKHHKEGLRQAKAVIAGEPVTNEEFDKAKKSAGLAAGLVFGALAATAILVFAPALAGPAGALFLLDKSGDFSGSLSSGDTSDRDAADVLDAVYEWVVSQDPEVLKTRLEKFNG